MSRRVDVGALLWVGCLQYFVAEAVCISAWRGVYSLRNNYISDLGARACPGAGAGVATVCSPLHDLMNASFLLQGALLAIGTCLVFPRRPASGWGAAGLGFVAASGLGVALVGWAPEDVAPGWHYLGAGENLIFSNLGTLLTGVALAQGPKSGRRFAAYSVVSGLVGLAAVALIGSSMNFGGDVGIVERLAAYPFPIWISMFGLRMLRSRFPASD